MTSIGDATRRTDSLARRRAAMGAGSKASARLRQSPRRPAMLPWVDEDMKGSRMTRRWKNETNLGGEERNLQRLRKHPNSAKNSLDQRLMNKQ